MGCLIFISDLLMLYVTCFVFIFIQLFGCFVFCISWWSL